MLQVPMNTLPPLALEFARKLCREVGGCIETYMTAYAVYAQLVENLPCDDSLYQARTADVEWFKDMAAGKIATLEAKADAAIKRHIERGPLPEYTGDGE